MIKDYIYVFIGVTLQLLILFFGVIVDFSPILFVVLVVLKIFGLISLAWLKVFLIPIICFFGGLLAVWFLIFISLKIFKFSF